MSPSGSFRPLAFAVACVLFGAQACGSEAAGGAEPPPETPSDPSPVEAGAEEDAAVAPDAEPSCQPPVVPECTSAPPFVGPERGWRHIGVHVGANHRGRDLFVNPGTPQWIIGRFAYGAALAEVKVRDEEVDIWLNRECGVAWEKIGTVLTTDEPSKPAVEGIADEPGRIFFQIPENKRLGLGRHRVRLVMMGDLSWVELFIEVVAPGTPMFVSDVDGTLTTSESVEFTSLLTGSLSPAHPSAAAALSTLASKGYRPMYLTARPEWLVERTRDFVRDRGFPPGIIHTTTTGVLPANGPAAVDFKTGELSMLEGKGLRPAWVIGNTETDAQAYENAGIQPLQNRLFFQFGEANGGLIFGGRRFESYATLMPEFQALPTVCP